ncbi:PREDICTED: lysM and putative peptidoglycan-binding domain-containing protein 1-like [Priapulus caudatus]|uniref:LysM and putative peptidoglycan-binding domain-containing protein 1-like n=1 Tax=Priapulus caudatus TaxID=37621 RepID=A0ABM1E323_PRICU|nr:PREDICTED: lysM and putative peptidoglycan-binding domain-containing protein 1-like [Priapulus caudatus]
MAECVSDETASLGFFVKKQAKYGTATTTYSKKEAYTVHEVSASDTLQGIALKYGVSMGHLKRANRLWTNDSLFLHPTLKIPIIEKQEEDVMDFFVNANGADAESASTSSSSDFVGEEQSAPSGSDSAKESCTARLGEGTISPCRTGSPRILSNSRSPARQVAVEEKEISVTDFLRKIDNETAQIKSKVKRLERGADFEDDGRLSASKKNRKPKTALHHNSPRLGRAENLRDPELCIKPSPKHVRSSLRKVAQDGQDDIFEL